MAHQGPIDRREPRHRIEALVGEPGADRAWSPSGVFSAQCDHPGLGDRCHLVRAALGLRTLVGQGRHAAVGITTQPGVDTLAADPVAPGHVCYGHPVEDVDHRSIALLHGFELHQHGRPPSVLSTTASTAKKVAAATWWTSQARSVKQVPESVSPRYRNRARECQAGAGSTPSSMNRNFTSPHPDEHARFAPKQSVGHRLSVRAGHLTCEVGERATGIEPAFSAWEADVLPLNYARENPANLHAGQTPTACGGAPGECRARPAAPKRGGEAGFQAGPTSGIQQASPAAGARLTPTTPRWGRPTILWAALKSQVALALRHRPCLTI